MAAISAFRSQSFFAKAFSKAKKGFPLKSGCVQFHNTGVKVKV
jgi:hypothetical protein